jgi:hypothetical protein
MLKRVIKYRTINTLICGARTRYGRNAIRTNRHWHSRKHRSELFRFIRYSIACSVATQRNHRMMTGRLQRLNTPANKRRLSRAAHRNISNTDHWNSNGCRGSDACIPE